MTNPGLEQVVVADTVLSDVDGAGGRLILRGHPVEALAGSVGFEAAAGLMLEGALPSPERAREIAQALGRGRAAAGAISVAALPDAMDRLRAAAAIQPSSAEPLALAGVLAVAAARAARPGAAPDPSRGHAADYLAMLGLPSDATRAAALESYWVTVIDHGMNASTFAARVVASTGSDRVSAITAAIGALKGPLHGGAPGPVLDMLDAIESPDRARRWLEAELAAGRRIMGLGHRVYRVRDPRAAVLERTIAALENTHRGERLALARAVEREAEALLAERHPERPLKANVEFYTAVLLEALGIPRALFSATFACGRVIGWCAHFEEQQRTGRLIRPSARYVGP